MNSQFLFVEAILLIMLITSSVAFTVGVFSFENIWKKRKSVGAKVIKLHRVFWIIFIFLMGVSYGIYIIYPEEFYHNELVQKCLYVSVVGTVIYGVIGLTLRLYVERKTKVSIN